MRKKMKFVHFFALRLQFLKYLSKKSKKAKKNHFFVKIIVYLPMYLGLTKEFFMKLNRSLMLAASVSFAMAFMFSCSSNDNPGDSLNDNSGENLGSNDIYSSLPKQLYLQEGYSGGFSEYKGNGDIQLILEKEDENENLLFSDTSPVGTIQNGQIALNLPENLDSKYLYTSDELFMPYCKGDSEGGISATQGLLAFFAMYIDAIIPGKSRCDLVLRSLSLLAPDEYAYFVYSSQAGKITGTTTCNEYNYHETATYDMNLSKGWNIVYFKTNYRNDGDDSERYFSTNSNIITSELTWVAMCGN
jgi:hypothetical protein